MTSEKEESVIRKGDDYKTELFDIGKYLKDVWSGYAIENNVLAREILNDLHKIFQTGIKMHLDIELSPPAFIGNSPVIAKYAGHAGHVRQTSADVWQRTHTLPDILSSRVEYT